jgi:hypothetical protein
LAEALRAHLINPVQARQPFENAWRTAKAWLVAGHRCTLVVKPEGRSLDQNAKFHAQCEDFARAGIEWAGKRRNAAEWKVLLVSGHAVATKEGAEMVPGLEGEFVNLRESTARMSKARSSSLIEYTNAMGANKGVVFTGEAC